MKSIGSPGSLAPAEAAGSARHAALSADDVVEFVELGWAALVRHEALLDRLDAALGDGDHGTNMAMGFAAAIPVARAALAEHPEDVGELLRLLGHTLVASVGGASGPLYGTAFIEAGFALAGRARAGPTDLAAALEQGQAGLMRRGRCAVGDKTILDSLDPAVRALRSAADGGKSLGACAEAAAAAAAAGMRATIPLVARRGLALRLGERSRGHRDPGATSCFLLLVAMARVAGRPAHE
jgi:phosphoenolpyruvate---glycerone phosphotransferase subunit DhaL